MRSFKVTFGPKLNRMFANTVFLYRYCQQFKQNKSYFFKHRQNNKNLYSKQH